MALRGDGANAHRVVVAGGGPVGLAAALSAHRAGANVVVLEKRVNYTRDTWFDLLPKPHASGRDWFEAVGGELVSRFEFF